jgi:cysteine desulfurase
MRTVYLDNNATTAVAPEVFDAMRPYFVEHYGNASSVHRVSTTAAAGLREARRKMARALGCDDGEIVLTSCGTESDNTAIRGVLEESGGKRHIVTTAVEHPAVLNLLREMEGHGAAVTVLGVDSDGGLDLDELRAALRNDTALVTIMLANNETGVLFPLDEIAAIVGERGIPLHTDAVQAVGKVPIDLSRLRVDLLALSAHKFHGPKGVGALFVRRGTACHPLLVGGSQERGRRAGTENVGGIVAMAMALEMATEHLDHYHAETRRMRDRLERGLLSAVPGAFVNGAGSPRLPNTSSICFPGVDAHAMLLLLDEVGICASAGSACKSGSGAASPVLAAMGVSPDDARGMLRLSLSAATTDDEVDYALDQIPKVVARMRASSHRAHS